MRKHRSWLMGLGIGLILGASMLQLILMAQDQLVIATEQPITQVQLAEEAQKSGLVLLTTEQLEDQVNAAVTAALEEETNNESSNLNDTQGAQELLEEDVQSTEVDDSSSTGSSGSEEQTAIRLNVPYRMSLTEVAAKLEELGIINDADDFVTQAAEISKKLRVGTSILHKKMSYEQIMTELIRVK
jgi:hypothetical protein